MNVLKWELKRSGTVYYVTISSLDATYLKRRCDTLVGTKGVTNIQLSLAGG